MTPIVIVLVLVVLVLIAGIGWLWKALRGVSESVAYLQKSQLEKYLTPPVTPAAQTTGISDNELVKLALEEMSKVSQMALNPYPAGPPAADADGLHPPRQMTALEMIVDDEADPMEVFLGPDYLRETSAVLGSDDESPFGVPGLRATGGLT